MQQEAVAPAVVPRTLGEAIEINAAARPQAPAIVFPDGALLSYSALSRQVEEIGAELRRAGVGARNRVAVALSDGPELAIAIAAISCHATVVPLNPKLTPAETEDLFITHRIDALVMPDNASSPAREIAARHGACLLAASRREDGVGLTLRASSRSRAVEDIAIGPDTTAIILRTSGTTARPKLVAITHANLLAMAARLRFWFDLVPSDRVLCVAPLYYAQGLKISLFVPLILGGSIACPSRSSGSDFFSWLAELKPTWYSAGPTFHHSVLDVGQALQKTKFFHSLRFIHSAAAPLPDAIHDGLETMFGVPVINSYGLSEAGLVAANSIASERRKRGTVGKFWSGELAIRSEDGGIANIGGPGEIVVRGPGLTPGYIDDPEAYRSAFTDGWFRTGDLGRIDADGFLTISGRINELINRGGEKIAPTEIDDALLRHPAVAQAAAFSVPHPRLGEDIAAAVIIKPGAAVTPRELRRFLQTTLAPFKLPRRIYLVASLPKGDTGKIRRQELSRIFWTRSAERPALHWHSTLEIEIAEIWQQLLGCKSIGPEDDFFEMGGDSLLATQMLLELERLTGRVLQGAMLFENATIRQLAESLVHNNTAEHQDLLLQLQPGTGAAPFIFIDGDFWGGGYYVRHLVRLLGPEWPVYSLRSHALLGNRIPSIEQMAEDYKRALDTAGIYGPYRLGGHCNGALIALELAHQLEASGREVELVAMVEPVSLNARPSMRLVARALGAVLNLVVRDATERQARMAPTMSWVWRITRTVYRQSELPQPRPQSLFWWAARKAKGFLHKRRGASKTDDNVGTLATKIGNENWTLANLTEVYHQRMASYIPKPVAARLLCVVSESNARSAEFSAREWRNFAPHSEVTIVPGNHFTCITTHAGALTNHLRERLTALDHMTKFGDADTH